jgi:hypothetical protein
MKSTLKDNRRRMLSKNGKTALNIIIDEPVFKIFLKTMKRQKPFIYNLFL